MLKPLAYAGSAAAAVAALQAAAFADESSDEPVLSGNVSSDGAASGVEASEPPA